MYLHMRLCFSCWDMEDAETIVDICARFSSSAMELKLRHNVQNSLNSQ